MFDPKSLLDSAMQKMSSVNKTGVLLSMLEQMAQFVDKHDIIVPELSVSFGGVALTLTGKKLEDSDASKRISTDEIKTDPNLKAHEG